MPRRLILLYLGLGLAALLLGAVLWQLNQAKKQATLDEEQAVEAEERVEDALASDPDTFPQYIEAIPGTDEVWYGIPEFGVELRLNRLFAEDLVYQFTDVEASTGEIWEEVLFSQRSIASADPNCFNAAGSLVKVSTELKDHPKPESLLIDMTGFTQLGEAHYGLIELEADAACQPSSGGEEEVQAMLLKKYPGKGAHSLIDGMKTLQILPDEVEE